LARDERLAADRAVENLKHRPELVARVLGGVRRLFQTPRHERMRILEDRADARHDAELDDALELADARTLERRRPDHRRVRVQLLEVLHDREGLAEMAAVVEFENGKSTHRV